MGVERLGFDQVFPAHAPPSPGDRCLKGCVEKVKRARQNVEILNTEISRYFSESNPYRVVLDDSWFKSGNHIMQMSVVTDKPRRLRLAVLHEPPHEAWSVRVGEIVHDYRSALDQIVWGLSCRRNTPPPDPIPFGNPWRSVQFPVVTDLTRWTKRCDKLLCFVEPPRLRASFRVLQPFYRRKHPERHPLAVLEELWNLDKHRSLHFIQSLTGIHELKPQSPEFFGAQAEFGVGLVQRRIARPAEHGAVLGSVRFGGPWYADQQGYVDVHLQLAGHITFEQGPPAFGTEVFRMLDQIDKFVSMVVARYEPHLR